MTQHEESLIQVLGNTNNILSTVRFRNEELFEKFADIVDMSVDEFGEEDEETNDFKMMVKVIVLAKEIEDYYDNFRDDELDLFDKYNDFNAYISQSLLALIFDFSNDPFARHQDEEMQQMAMHILNDLANEYEVSPWAVSSVMQFYALTVNLIGQLYQLELNEEELSGVNANTVEQVSSILEKKTQGREEVQQLLVNSFCFVMAVVLKLLALGREKTVHKNINATFVVKDQDPISLLLGFKRKYTLYVGSYCKLLQSVEEKVSEVSLTQADWHKGMLGFQIENDILVAQNPLDRGANMLFPMAKAFKEYTKESGVKLEVCSFSIF